MEMPSTYRIPPQVPEAIPRPTRGWASSTSAIHRRIMNELNIVDAQVSKINLTTVLLHVILENMADVLMDASFVSFVVDVIIGTIGAEAPGVAPTPRQRGPPPLPSRRGGRLPNCLAVKNRPNVLVLSLLLISFYMNINTTHLRLEVPLTLRTSRVAPTAR